MGEMSKSPEEIKKGLSVYTPEEIKEILQQKWTIHSSEKLYRSALAYIQQLEQIALHWQSSMDQVQKALQDNGFQTLEKLLQVYSQVKRERDALTNDLYSVVNDYVTPCFCCKIFDPSTTVCEHEGVDCFIWRGVQEPPEEDT